MSKYDQKLNQIFDIVPVESKVIESTGTSDSSLSQKEIDRESDIKKAKEVHYDLLEKSKDALNELLGLAKISESPRAYEVLSNLIKTTSEVSKTLLEIDKPEEKKKADVQNNTQNNIFFGSTAELQKFLKENK